MKYNLKVSSNKDGELVMLNMMLKEYHIGVIKGGYYSYCNSYTLKEKP